MDGVFQHGKPIFALTVTGSASVTVVVLQIIADTTRRTVAGGSRGARHARTVTR